MAGIRAWMESFSRCAKLRANKIRSEEGSVLGSGDGGFSPEGGVGGWGELMSV